ncbi:MAG: hypothetical protein ABJF11_03715 [Reichenbachiella sp.]|uniref:hypothetical protein n=1 Tax=Reichenbachiella sp. TaxID=2184521 RepID=UPI0032631B8C
MQKSCEAAPVLQRKGEAIDRTPHQKATPLSFGKLAVSLVLVAVLGLFPHIVEAQTLRYPANATPVLTTPYSSFLSDYSEPGGNKLSATVVFNDFNEPQWNFRFRLTIESNDLRLTTSPNFIPSAPITVTPGVPEIVSGEDWLPYFEYQNLVIEGLSRKELERSGRLPEGFYSFCIEVLDYNTGETLSRKTCASAWIQLNDPARIISPICGKFIDPNSIQIPFQWQMFNTQSPNATMGTAHQLTMWEITDNSANPMSAVANGQALQVFQTDLLSGTNYVYGPSDPALELGKHYIYQIQSFDPEGRDTFKNNGYSEFCDFYYGWPSDGKVSLLEPGNNDGFRRRQLPVMKWSSVDNMIPGQWVSYEVQIGEIEEDEIPDENIHFDNLWYSRTLQPTSMSYDMKVELGKLPAVTKKYIWRVVARTGEQEVGRSKPSLFYGPSLVERFYAEGHKIWVDAITNADIKNLAGEGRIRLTANKNDWTKIKFKGLKLKENGGYYILEDGEIIHELDEHKLDTLNAEFARNGYSLFGIEKYRINKEGLSVYGDIDWDLPFATTASEKAVVRTDKGWMVYDDFTVNGALKLHEENTYDLLDPFKFTLDLHTSSYIYVNTDKYWFEFDGNVNLPGNVKGIFEDQLVSVPFFDAEHVFYIELDQPEITNHVSVLNNTRIELRASTLTIDFSEKESPVSFSGQPDWKGVYFNSFQLRYNKNVDASGQVTLDKVFNKPYELTSDGPEEAWVTTKGFDFKIDKTFADGDFGKFNTFPAKLNRIQLELKASKVVGESKLEGEMLIPVVSTEEPFDFTIPLSNMGFRTGYLHDLDETAFTFNKDGGEQLINILIKRAVFADNNRLNMTIDVEWPALEITMKSVVGFKAWGDYTIGFNTKNGALPLSQRLNGKMSGYPVVIHTIGAGSSEGNYSFATTIDSQLGDDVSGGEGAPQVNVYSIVANEYVPKDAEAFTDATSDQPEETQEEKTSQITQQYQESETALLSKLVNSQEGILNTGNSLKASLAGSPAEAFAPTQIYTGPGFDPGTGHLERGGAFFDKLSPEQKEQFDLLITGLVSKLAEPVTSKINKKTKEITDQINGSIDDLTLSATIEIENKVDALVQSIADELINTLQNDLVDVSGPIAEIATATATSIKGEVSGALNQSVDTNVRTPVISLLQDGIAGRVNGLIIDQGAEIVYGVFEGKPLAGGDALEGVVTGIPTIIEDAAKDALNMVKPDKLASTIQALGQDFITNISVGDIAHDISSHIDDIIKQALKDAANDKINDIASQYANEVLNFGEGDAQIPIDFVGVATRLAKGDVKGIFAADPVRVKLNTPVIALDGFIKYTPDDAVFGDVWSGDVIMSVKVPRPFQLNALYFNGKKGDTHYWFCQIDPAFGDKSQGRQPGDVLSKEPREMPKPVSMGIVDLVGISGRLYHHMSEQPSGIIVPDEAMKYGAYLNMVLFDKSTNGEVMRLQLAGEINSKENGDYTVALEGNAHLLGQNTVKDGDKRAVIQGTVKISYNSAEKHFIGYASVDLKHEALCAHGSLLVDVKPGKWRVAIGTREDRLSFIPACAGWAPTGWLDVNQNVAELGLGVSFSLSAQSPTINLFIVKFNVAVDAGVAFGVQAAVQYRPSFALVKAGVWLDVWVTLDVNYQTRKITWRGFSWSSWKSITLVDIFIRGDLVMIFKPSPTTLEGSVRGHVSVLCFSKNFNAHMSKTL